MHSDAKNVNGENLFEWTLDANSGEIMEATREQDGSKEKIIEREVSPESLKNDEVVKALEAIEANKPEVMNQVTAQPEESQVEASASTDVQTTTTEESSVSGATPMSQEELDM